MLYYTTVEHPQINPYAARQNLSTNRPSQANSNQHPSIHHNLCQTKPFLKPSIFLANPCFRHLSKSFQPPQKQQNPSKTNKNHQKPTKIIKNQQKSSKKPTKNQSTNPVFPHFSPVTSSRKAGPTRRRRAWPLRVTKPPGVTSSAEEALRCWRPPRSSNGFNYKNKRMILMRGDRW